MLDEQLREQLRGADQTPESKSTVPDIALQVRHQVSRRRQRRRIVGSLGLVLLVIGGYSLLHAVWMPSLSNKPPQPRHKSMIAAESPHQSSARQEIAALQQELVLLREQIAQSRRDLAELAAQQEQLTRHVNQSPAAPAKPLYDVMQVRSEQTATALLLQAQRRYEQLGLAESAVREWRTIIRYFPETRAAQKARQKLSEMNENLQGDRHDPQNTIIVARS